jgi:hypothetical protein
MGVSLNGRCALRMRLPIPHEWLQSLPEGNGGQWLLQVVVSPDLGRPCQVRLKRQSSTRRGVRAIHGLREQLVLLNSRAREEDFVRE